MIFVLEMVENQICWVRKHCRKCVVGLVKYVYFSCGQLRGLGFCAPSFLKFVVGLVKYVYFLGFMPQINDFHDCAQIEVQLDTL